MAHSKNYERFNPMLLKLGRILDFLEPIFRIIFKPSENIKLPQVSLSSLQPEKILIIESHLIGDTVLLTPLLVSLRNQYPKATIDVVGNDWIQDILMPLNIIDNFRIIRIPWSTYDYSIKNIFILRKKVLSLKLSRYDLAIDPRGDARNILMLWFTGAKRRLSFGSTGCIKYLTDIANSPNSRDHLLKAKFSVLGPLGIFSKPDPPKLIASVGAELAIEPFLEKFHNWKDKKIIGFHPGASQQGRRLDIWQKVRIIYGIKELGGNPLLIGSTKERNELEQIAIISENPDLPIFTGALPEFMALTKHLNIFVGMDSGPAHISAAFGTPTVVMAELQKDGITTPLGDHVKIVTPMPGTEIQDLNPDLVIEALRDILLNQII